MDKEEGVVVGYGVVIIACLVCRMLLVRVSFRGRTVATSFRMTERGDCFVAMLLAMISKQKTPPRVRITYKKRKKLRRTRKKIVKLALKGLIFLLFYITIISGKNPNGQFYLRKAFGQK